MDALLTEPEFIARLMATKPTDEILASESVRQQVATSVPTWKARTSLRPATRCGGIVRRGQEG